MTTHQGTDYERVVAATSDADLAAALDRLAADANAYSPAASKVIYAEAARRLRDGKGDQPATDPVGELTADDRNRVADVLDELMDELEDAYTAEGMFAPHAAIVRIALTDEAITAARRERYRNGGDR